MAAGKFRDLAVFERLPEGALDRFGNPDPTAWEAVASLRGWLRETTGKERIAAGRQEAPATATLRVRASASAPVRGVLASDRVRVRGQVWAITGPGIDPDGQGRLVEFALERGGAS